MRIINPLRTLSLLVLFLLVNQIFATDIPKRPNPPRLVNDFANILSDYQKNALEKKLVRFNDTTSNQITVVIVNSLNGYTPAMFATDIGLEWKVGQKEFDNGVVVLVKPKLGSTDKGQAYIAVGYGLEPVIPDAIAKRIIENEMIPSFRNGDYYNGIDKATNVLMELAAGEITADMYGDQTGNGFAALIPFIILFVIVILIRRGRYNSHGIGSRGSGSFWTALWLGSMLNNSSSHSGSWNNFTNGSSGFGGGGGFGGFGGGSFGGGGAGGSW
jgi:uncharacterized protein